jgi:hypothetical protein
MAQGVIPAPQATPQVTGQLRREVGLTSLMFISLGSIIGSGWLLGALLAAQIAGPASLLSWILGGAIIALLALIHAELGSAYPMAGGTARFPHLVFGSIPGFTAGWAAWLQAVTIARCGPGGRDRSTSFLRRHLNKGRGDEVGIAVTGGDCPSSLRHPGGWSGPRAPASGSDCGRSTAPLRDLNTEWPGFGLRGPRQK